MSSRSAASRAQTASVRAVSPVPPAARRFSGTVETSAARRHQRSSDAAQPWIASSADPAALPGRAGDVAAERVDRAPVSRAPRPSRSTQPRSSAGARRGVVVDELVGDPAVLAAASDLGEREDLVSGRGSRSRADQRAPDAAHGVDALVGQRLDLDRDHAASSLTRAVFNRRLINRDGWISSTITFGALADPTRRAILARLAHGEATVNELAEPFPISLQAVSKHLKVLERAGLIVARADRQLRPSRLQGEALREAAEFLDDYRRVLGRELRPARASTSGIQRELEITPRLRARRASASGRAWTEPEQLARWWGKRGWNARPGLDRARRAARRRRSASRPSTTTTASEMTNEATFTEVVEPERLAFGETVVTFTDLGDGRTEMTFRTTTCRASAPPGGMEQRVRAPRRTPQGDTS